MKSNRAIAILVPTLVTGGVQKSMLNLSDGLCQAGFNVTFLTTNFSNDLLDEIPAGVKLHVFKTTRILYSIPFLIVYLWRKEPEVLISAQTHANIASIICIALTGSKTKSVITEHSMFSGKKENYKGNKIKLLSMMAKVFYRKASEIVAVSEGVASDVKKLLDRESIDISVIYNPVNIRQIRELSKFPVTHRWFDMPGKKVIVAVGRLTAAKDYPTLLLALEIACQKSDLGLLIIGEGEERHNIEGLIVDLKLSETVELMGNKKNPYSYMANSSLFVLSSVVEGFGIALVEALALGLPIVSTDCLSGPSEILKKGAYGKLVPIQEPAKLAAAILDSLKTNNPKSGATRRAESFAIKAITKQYIDIISR